MNNPKKLESDSLYNSIKNNNLEMNLMKERLVGWNQTWLKGIKDDMNKLRDICIYGSEDLILLGFQQ